MIIYYLCFSFRYWRSAVAPQFVVSLNALTDWDIFVSDMCEVSHNSGIRGLPYFYIQIWNENLNIISWCIWWWQFQQNYFGSQERNFSCCWFSVRKMRKSWRDLLYSSAKQTVQGKQLQAETWGADRQQFSHGPELLIFRILEGGLATLWQFKRIFWPTLNSSKGYAFFHVGGGGGGG